MNARNLIAVFATPVLAACCFLTLSQANADPEAATPTIRSEGREVTHDLSDALARASREVSRTALNEHAEWHKINAGDVQEYTLEIDGWTVFTMEVAGDTPLSMSIYDAEFGKLLASYDGEGCGILLHNEKPRLVNVVIENFYRFDNTYFLNVY